MALLVSWTTGCFGRNATGQIPSMMASVCHKHLSQDEISVLHAKMAGVLQVGAAFMSHSLHLPDGKTVKFEIW